MSTPRVSKPNHKIALETDFNPKVSFADWSSFTFWVKANQDPAGLQVISGYHQDFGNRSFGGKSFHHSLTEIEVFPDNQSGHEIIVHIADSDAMVEFHYNADGLITTIEAEKEYDPNDSSHYQQGPTREPIDNSRSFHSHALRFANEARGTLSRDVH